MSEKTYTLEEAMKITSDFIMEQGRILEKNLKEKKRTVNGELCTK